MDGLSAKTALQFNTPKYIGSELTNKLIEYLLLYLLFISIFYLQFENIFF